MKRTITILVENRFGSFDRIATMFSGKGFNIHSISIGETEIQDISRMTIVTSGNDQIIDQVVKQLNRLIDTIKVTDLSDMDRTERELALITLPYQKGSIEEIKNISDIFRGFVVDINNKSITLEITGPPAKINAAVNVLMPYGIKEMARSGTVALSRGEQLKTRKMKVA
ncbi:MAG: acetolactate synthase small subunit [Calditrichaceae bacterium]|nr:acetolactate synthase small subunit [Calditrichaceae bacterium]MBN2710557.1 acetolactate synthase small subunit [Calditrichaceae bacterium]RQV96530.1 MAG: acetolactate synthase small subunit [Calditrichota bacterium]